ncbi:hypothetical protein RRG08_055821 [Elysia crispata]|uniref:Uncharacterized protein n=1 Tax=Elysia crispata TaxID=231223 RepID=A0AAE1AWL7_9GAST|nr:hypothetical protein RRG08_055821 [Elysia crispata]
MPGETKSDKRKMEQGKKIRERDKISGARRKANTLGRHWYLQVNTQATDHKVLPAAVSSAKFPGGSQSQWLCVELMVGLVCIALSLRVGRAYRNHTELRTCGEKKVCIGEEWETLRIQHGGQVMPEYWVPAISAYDLPHGVAGRGDPCQAETVVRLMMSNSRVTL